MNKDIYVTQPFLPPLEEFVPYFSFTTRFSTYNRLSIMNDGTSITGMPFISYKR